jgi:hypothetical protein
MSVSDQPDFLTIVISRLDIESGDISETLSVLSKLLEPGVALRFCEKVDIGVHGYDEDARELNELQEVRDFVNKLDDKFPYWCYFLSKRGSGLMFILSCFCPPYLTLEARDRIWTEKIAEYLTRRGFPALNHLCGELGCSESEVRRLTDRVTEYIIRGVDRSEA